MLSRHSSVSIVSLSSAEIGRAATNAGLRSALCPNTFQ
jgi:hypothetical protein